MIFNVNDKNNLNSKIKGVLTMTPLIANPSCIRSSTSKGRIKESAAASISAPTSSPA
jgi:hypothetical protein